MPSFVFDCTSTWCAMVAVAGVSFACCGRLCLFEILWVVVSAFGCVVLCLFNIPLCVAFIGYLNSSQRVNIACVWRGQHVILCMLLVLLASVKYYILVAVPVAVAQFMGDVVGLPSVLLVDEQSVYLVGVSMLPLVLYLSAVPFFFQSVCVFLKRILCVLASLICATRRRLGSDIRCVFLRGCACLKNIFVCAI